MTDWYRYIKKTKDGRRFIIAIFKATDDNYAASEEKNVKPNLVCVDTNSPARFVMGHVYILYPHKDIIIEKLKKNEIKAMNLVFALDGKKVE